MSRVKKKMESNKEDASKLKVLTKMQNPNQQTLDNFAKSSRQSDKIDVVMVPTSKNGNGVQKTNGKPKANGNGVSKTKNSKRKKKMALDSDS